MSLKFNTPKSVQSTVVATTDVNDALVTKFTVERQLNYISPTTVEIETYVVGVEWVYANKSAPGEFDVVGRDSIQVTGNQARNFLQTAVDGPLGRVTEEAILSALAAAGRIPAGIVEDE